MLQVEFNYPIRGQEVKILATCTGVLGAEYVEGLTLSFFNDADDRILVPFDQDLFDDIESEAVYMLADAYYNPELNFNHAH